MPYRVINRAVSGSGRQNRKLGWAAGKGYGGVFGNSVVPILMSSLAYILGSGEKTRRGVDFRWRVDGVALSTRQPL